MAGDYKEYGKIAGSPRRDDNMDAGSLEEQELQRYKQDSHHRKSLVRWMMWLVSLWLLSVITLVFLDAALGWEMDGRVLMVLLATTTFNVLGLANIILKGLFPHRIRPPKRVRKSEIPQS